MKNNLIKGFTIIFFIGLISTFVLYKAGFFSKKYGATKKNSDVSKVNNYKLDSLNIDDSLSDKMKLMPSSKVLILTEGENNDSTPQKLNSKELNNIMSSSKSGQIIHPTFKKDTIKNEKNK